MRQVFLIILIGIVVVTTEYSQTCLNPTPISKFDERDCVSLNWYQVAGNTPCENCCIFRNMTLLRPGHVAVTDTIVKPNGTTVYNYIGLKDKKDSIYRIENSTSVFAMLDTDCKQYAVLYDLTNNIFQIWTVKRNPEKSFLTSLQGVQQCNLNVLYYNTTTVC